MTQRLCHKNRSKECMENVTEDIKNRCIRVKEFDTENGGIYLEITDDPRGWMLGDKTRKIYNATLAQVMLTTNLIMVVTPQGDKLRVRVCNPKEVARMLLSKNDDVGSSIMYANIGGPSGPELTAEKGNHVCIESMINGSWIRVQIFPGKNVMK